MRRLLWLAAAVFLFHAAAFALIADNRPFGDEWPHYEQIKSFYQGDWTVNPRHAMLTTYHWVAATAARVCGTVSLEFVRAFSWFSGLAALGLFYFCASDPDPRDRLLRTLQLAVFPLAFPFYFMIYTDVFSLALLLGAAAACGRRQNGAGGILAAASMAVRQSNVVWAAFLWAKLYVDDHGFRPSREALAAHCLRTKAFLAGFALFAGFVIANGRVSVGLPYATPAGLYAENVFFFPFIFFFMFLPVLAPRLPAARRWAGRFFVAASAAVLFVIYMTTFGDLHVFNDVKHPVFQTVSFVMLRNHVLAFFLSNAVLKALFFLPVLASIGLIAVTPLKRASDLLLYPASAAFLLPQVVVDPRYYIVPSVFFLLYRKMESPKNEYTQLALWALLSAALIYGIAYRRYIL